MSSFSSTFLRHRGPGIRLGRWKSTIRKIDKLLIANRGEIACRVLRTAHRLGVKTVAVYSEADEDALHVSQADEAYKIGPAAASRSYLNSDKILNVALKSGCQAVHPGYGFLSENVEFAQKCEESGVIFVGPPASAIRDMGIKSKSKEIMSRAGVPIIGGYHGDDQSDTKLKEEASKIGYPLMIKAVRGGGGKGMRIALSEAEFEQALESAKTESAKAFGDDVVLLERYVAEPRHVEVQIFADRYGNVVHLFERDCSVQRRHQKIIEEAPAPGLSEELRAELGAASVRAAKAVGYVGAGTVEFILDRNTHGFHFMEMNTRLQVEHPITEMITGTDLVEWQIKVAQGEQLPLTQDQIHLNGHAFEARIYAENPDAGFLPGAGTLTYLRTPPPQPHLRIETGVAEGDEVSVHYDPMIAKLVVWGEDRSEALSKLRSVLLQYNVAGLETNINFLLDLARHPEFESGNVHTHFIDENRRSLFTPKPVTDAQITQAALATVLTDELIDISNAAANEDHFNPFVVESAFRPNYHFIRRVKLRLKDGGLRHLVKGQIQMGFSEVVIEVKILENNLFEVSLDEGRGWRTVRAELFVKDGQSALGTTIDDFTTRINVFAKEGNVSLFDHSGKTEFLLETDAFLVRDEEEISGKDLRAAVAPMPGVLDKMLVKIGDEVRKGDSLFVLVAMKMEHVVKANTKATIENIYFRAGDNVQKDATIVRFKEGKK